MTDAAASRVSRSLSRWASGLRHAFARPALRAFAFAAVIAAASPALAQPEPPTPPPPADAYIDLDRRFGDLKIDRSPEGYRISVGDAHGLTPDQFVAIIYREKQEQAQAGIVFVIFNITTWWGLLWISVGLLGQIFFTFRMVLQWLASEKQHKSVVPVGFWWGSLIGGIMLLTYFIWRKDAIGILGQSTGAFIYARNLWLIYFGQKPAATPPPEKAAPPVNPDTGSGHG